jgi:hypothetical protein
MGYSQIVRGQVGSIARGINVANAQPNGQGLATVNPIFTWVRLAQCIPVRIQIDQVPPGVTLVAGENLGRMTVSVGASFFEYGWQLRRLGPRDFTIEQHVLRPAMAGDMLGSGTWRDNREWPLTNRTARFI